MLKESEPEETIGFFVTYLALVVFQLGASRVLQLPQSVPKQLTFSFYGDFE